MRSRLFLVFGIVLLLVGVLTAWSALNHPSRAVAAPEIYASPVHAGCYIAARSDCRIHVEPFTINIASGEKLVHFKLIAIQQGTGLQTMIYDFRPDQSNPVPYSGDSYTPSLVAQDYAATCGASYEISLQGQDTGDSSTYNLGLTSFFACPSTMP